MLFLSCFPDDHLRFVNHQISILCRFSNLSIVAIARLGFYKPVLVANHQNNQSCMNQSSQLRFLVFLFPLPFIFIFSISLSFFSPVHFTFHAHLHLLFFDCIFLSFSLFLQFQTLLHFVSSHHLTISSDPFYEVFQPVVDRTPWLS